MASSSNVSGGKRSFDTHTRVNQRERDLFPVEYKYSGRSFPWNKTCPSPFYTVNPKRHTIPEDTMPLKPSNVLLVDHNHDGVDRRGFLKCMAWAGTGAVRTPGRSAQVLQPQRGFAPARSRRTQLRPDQRQPHGVQQAGESRRVSTLQAAVAKINALPLTPEFMLHTGDITHLSKPAEFDQVQQVLQSARTKEVFFVPGEHDVLEDDGQQYRERFGKNTKGAGWYSFDKKGVHFVGLVNVMNLKAGGMGSLGAEQLKWLEDDVAHLSKSTPVVVFAHMPLWTVYPEWGWGTDDSAQALSSLKRFGSVTVLNGHIHQTMQKVEGNVTFHTAASTAFPQPHPGAAPSAGPMKVPAEQLRALLGVTDVNYTRGKHALAVIDSTLE